MEFNLQSLHFGILLIIVCALMRMMIWFAFEKPQVDYLKPLIKRLLDDNYSSWHSLNDVHRMLRYKYGSAFSARIVSYALNQLATERKYPTSTHAIRRSFDDTGCAIYGGCSYRPPPTKPGVPKKKIVDSLIKNDDCGETI